MKRWLSVSEDDDPGVVVHVREMRIGDQFRVGNGPLMEITGTREDDEMATIYTFRAVEGISTTWLRELQKEGS